LYSYTLEGLRLISPPLDSISPKHKVIKKEKKFFDYSPTFLTQAIHKTILTNLQHMVIDFFLKDQDHKINPIIINHSKNQYQTIFSQQCF